jgi:ABC-type dipeptide transport system, periplasmic component
VRAAELVSEQLREVGIGASAQTLDSGALSDLSDSKDYDIYVNNITAHGVADPTQFIMSHYSGYLWKLPDVPYPALEALIAEWKATETIEDRAAVGFRMQELFNRQPTSIPLHYPSGEQAYRPRRSTDGSSHRATASCTSGPCSRGRWHARPEPSSSRGDEPAAPLP